jgi:hypothetical protein
VHPTILVLFHTLIASKMCLLLRYCLTTKGGILFIDPLHSNDKVVTHTETQTDGSGAMICIPSFIKTGAGICKLMEEIGGGGGFRDRQTASQHGVEST